MNNIVNIENCLHCGRSLRPPPAAPSEPLSELVARYRRHNDAVARRLGLIRANNQTPGPSTHKT